MKLYQLVLKDILRRKKRLLYAALGVVIGTMSVIAILTISQAGKNQVYAQLEKYGPNLTLLPAVNTLDMKLGGVNLGQLSVGDNYIAQDKLPELRRIADGEIRKALEIEDDGTPIATIAPQLFVTAPVNEATVTVVGILPDEERTIKSWWTIKEGSYLKAEQPDGAVIGATAAEWLKLNVGDRVNLNGQDFTITGILEETGSNDDYQVFANLATVQTLYNKAGLLSVIDVRALCNACPVEVIANAINQNMTGIRAVAVKQVAESEMGMVEKINRFMLALGAVTLLIGLFGVMNTMMASVNERIKDIGIMRAVGASSRQITRVFIYEAIVIGIVGGIFGYLVGTGLAYLVGPMLFEGAKISGVPLYFPVAIGLAVMVAVLASLWPVHRATRVKVADCFASL